MATVCAVTGASGYVGSHIAGLLSQHFDVVPMGRSASGGILWQLGDDGLEDALRSRDVSVLVHASWDMAQTDAHRNWATNVEGTRKLVAQAKSAGVVRIVFISSISSFDGARSNYGKSKRAAEEIVLGAGGVVIRPGLVWGDRAGGMFGSLRKQVDGGGLIPMIGTGLYPQYLVHEEDLAAAVLAAAQSDTFQGRTLTIAQRQPWFFRDLILRIAAEQGKQIRLVSVPWRAVHAALRAAELLGLKLRFRSDSLVSMVHCNPHPAFSDEFPVRTYL